MLGHADGRAVSTVIRMSDMLAPMIICGMARVDLLDVADQTPGRSGHVRRAKEQSPGLGQQAFTG